MDKETFAALKEQIDQTEDPALKEMATMLYGSLLYTQYVRTVNPEVHQRAIAYMSETHGLDGVSFDQVV